MNCNPPLLRFVTITMRSFFSKCELPSLTMKLGNKPTKETIPENNDSANPKIKPANNDRANSEIKPDNNDSTNPEIKPENNDSTNPEIKPENNDGENPEIKPGNNDGANSENEPDVKNSTIADCCFRRGF